jgi:hypothetical protein
MPRWDGMQTVSKRSWAMKTNKKHHQWVVKIVVFYRFFNTGPLD